MVDSSVEMAMRKRLLLLGVLLAESLLDAESLLEAPATAPAPIQRLILSMLCDIIFVRADCPAELSAHPWV